MAARSRVLIAPRLLPTVGGPTLLGTVPDGYVWIVKSIRIVNLESALPSAFGLWTEPGDASETALYCPGTTVPAGAVLAEQVWQVFEAGTELHGEQEFERLNIRVSGAVLVA